MSNEAVIEQRLSVIGAALAEIQRHHPSQLPAPNWLEHVIGSFKHEPAFDEVLANGREFRGANRPPEVNGS